MQPAAPPVKADIYTAEWLRKQQHQPASDEPGDPVAATKSQPAAPQVPHPEPASEPTPEPAPKPANGQSFSSLDRNQPPVANPFINPAKVNPVPGATGGIFDAILDRGNSLRLSLSPDKRFPQSRPGKR